MVAQISEGIRLYLVWRRQAFWRKPAASRLSSHRAIWRRTYKHGGGKLSAALSAITRLRRAASGGASRSPQTRSVCGWLALSSPGGISAAS